MDDINNKFNKPTTTIKIHGGGLLLDELNQLEAIVKSNPQDITQEAEQAIKQSIVRLNKLAGVILPDDLSENYVRATDVLKIKEYSDDETLYVSLITFFLGGILGIIINLVTDDKEGITLDLTGTTVLCALTILTIGSGLLLLRNNNRSKPYYDKISKS